MGLTIGGTDVQDITIDGSPVQEVTIGGSTVWTATQTIAETGVVYASSTIDAGSTPSISFSKLYSNPVVAAYMATGNGGQFVAIRVRNVTSTGCQVFMEEPDNEGHSGNNIHYIVCEAGRWQTPEGVTIEAGTHTTSNVRRAGNSGNGYGDSISFSSSFPSTPVVLASLNTYNNGTFMYHQINSIGTGSFSTSQEALGTGKSASSETIGWIAIEQGSGSLNGYSYECGSASDGASDGYDNSPHSQSFSQSFSSTPNTVVCGQTLNGADGYVNRGNGVSSTSFSVYSDEDDIIDTERGHTDETFGWFAIDPGAKIIA